ncbi:MAG: hypothetical protein GAK35_02844 [Herbaspirillum frisingense]|uniref:Antirestriction protein ArdA n=1 Tax=Herbaspirillum frisingense TaxID=92645 RepID=A0A7V8JTT8_9BURK|nr:MAG: hypothetical protein GAK35_02844 [Herbaspirillum frisingense]
MTAIDNTSSVLDSRDIIARIEDLQETFDDMRESINESSFFVRHVAAGSTHGEFWEVADVDDEEFALACETEAEAVAKAYRLLDAENPDYTEEAEELTILLALAEECEGYGDWMHGETLIHRDHFVKYIEELIDDCYEMPKAMNSGEWPYRHLTMDYEAAAEEAEQDYVEFDFGGQEYLIRA